MKWFKSLIYAGISIFIVCVLVWAGTTSTNGYFYLPAIGASGSSERTTWESTQEATDAIIKANVDHAADSTQAHSDYLLNSGSDTMAGTLTADGLTLGANENVTLGAQTLDHDGTDFVFNDSISVTGDVSGTTIGGITEASLVDKAATEAITGDWDFGSGGLEVENATSVPGSCTVGQIFLDTDATSGQQLYACEGGTFTLQGDGGAGGGVDNRTACTFTVASSTAENGSNADYECDGTADDVQIDAAIQALPSSKGIVCLSEGRFNLTAPITFDGGGQGIRGVGTDMTELFLVSGTDTDLIEYNNSSLDDQWLFIEDMTINANDDNNTAGSCISTGIGSNDIQDVHISNVFCTDPSDVGIDIDDCWGLVVDRTTIEFGDTHGISCAEGSDAKIVNSKIISNGGSAIYMSPTGIAGFKIADNFLRGGGNGTEGIYIDGTRHTITGNVITDEGTTTYDGIHLLGDDNIVSDNTIYKTTDMDYGILIPSGANRNLVNGNHIDTDETPISDGGSNNWGINMIDDTPTTMNGYTVATSLTYALDLGADLILENDEFIDNSTNNQINLWGGGGTNNENLIIDLETDGNISFGSNSGASFEFDRTSYFRSWTIFTDDAINGLGSGKGYFEFDDQTTDEFNILNANVGIGTQTPSTKLDVQGDVLIVGTATADGLTLGASENLTIGAQTITHDGTDFILSDTPSISMNGQPELYFRDGNATAGDINVNLNANCSDTGDGTEDCDFVIQTQTAGTLTSRLLLDGDGNVRIVQGALDLGSTTQDGSLILHDDDGGGDSTVTIQALDATGTSYTLTLPPDTGSADEVLKTNGSGVLDWTSAGVASAGGSDAQVQYNNGGSLGGVSNVTFNDSTNVMSMSGTLQVTGTLDVSGVALLPKSVKVQLFAYDGAVTTGTVGFAPIGPLEDGYNVTDMGCNVNDKGVTGTTDVTVYRRRSGVNVEVLSTDVTIGDEWFATDGVVNTSNDDLAEGDSLIWNVTGIHSTAPNSLGCSVKIEYP